MIPDPEVGNKDEQLALQKLQHPVAVAEAGLEEAEDFPNIIPYPEKAPFCCKVPKSQEYTRPQNGRRINTSVPPLRLVCTAEL